MRIKMLKRERNGNLKPVLTKRPSLYLLITAQPMDCFAERIPLENKQLVGYGEAQLLRRDQ